MKPRLARFFREEWLQLILLFLPVLAALAAMPFATERVPMQWGVDGRVNWTAPKEWGLLVMPLTMLSVFILLLWLEKRDRSRRKDDGTLTSHGRATRTIRLAVSMVLGAVTLIQIAAALGRHPDVGRLVPTAVALLIAVLGNFFGKLKPNRYVGIRVPWTMKSERVWRVTHRFAGWLYTSTGLIMVMVIWLAPPRSEGIIIVAWVAALVLAPLWVAWRATVSEKKQAAGS